MEAFHYVDKPEAMMSQLPPAPTAPAPQVVAQPPVQTMAPMMQPKSRRNMLSWILIIALIALVYGIYWMSKKSSGSSSAVKFYYF